MKTKLKRLKNSQFLADRLTLCLAAIILVCSMIFIPMHARGDDGADSTLQGYDTTISHFSAIMAQAYNDMIATASSGGTGNTKTVIEAFENGKVGLTVANVGNYLGISAGSADADAVAYSNAASSGTAANVRTITVDGILGLYGFGGSSVPEASSSVGNNTIIQYILFGSSLRAIGIDEVKTAEENTDGIRKIIGYSTYLAYTMAYTANGLVGTVVKFLQQINPFYLLDTALTTTGGTGAASTTLQQTQFMKNVSSIYKQLKTWRFVIMGLMITFMVASITVFKSKSYNAAAQVQQKFKNLGIRLVIMFIGVPLVLMMFNEGLQILGKYTKQTNHSVSAYIVSTYCPFESWAMDPENAFKVSSGDKAFSVRYIDNTIQKVTKGKSSTDFLDSAEFVTDINASMSKSITTGSADKIKKLLGIMNDTSSTITVDQYSSMVKAADTAMGASAGGTTSIAEKQLYEYCRGLLMDYASGRVCQRDALDAYAQVSAAEAGQKFVYAFKGAVDNENGALISSWLSQLLTVGASGNHLWSALPNANNKLYKGSNKTKWKADGTEIEVGIPADMAAGAEGLEMTGGLGTSKLWEYLLKPNSGKLKLSRAYSSGDGTGKIPEAVKVIASESPAQVAFEYTYDLSSSGMAPLALYNYMCTYFHDGTADIYTPDQTSNAGVNCQHYAVTAAYSGFAEYVQLLYALAMLASLGLIAWVYAISLMMNVIVEVVKAMPTIFKMLFGSIQGFVEALLTVFSILIEIFITILFYEWSLAAIDFIIVAMKLVVSSVMKLFSTSYAESSSIVSSLIAIAGIFWATYQLIIWRKTIVIAFKSIITHALNQVFGTNAAMPTGASSGMLKGAAMLGAGAVMAHGLAQDGSLGDVVNDMTGSDVGDSLQNAYDESGGSIDEAAGGVGGIGGGMDRGSGMSETERASRALDGDKGLEGNSMYDAAGLTDEQEAEIGKKLEEGDFDGANELRQQYQEANENQRYADGEWRDELEDPGFKDGKFGDGSIDDMQKAAEYYQAKNAEVLGVDHATNSGVHGGEMAAEKSGKLGGEKYGYRAGKYSAAPSAYEPLAEKYDANGLTAEQAEAVSEMVENGASETEVAAAVDGYAQQNFGNSYATTVDSINQATGRTGAVTYGSMDNAEGNARTVSVASSVGANGLQSYTVNDATGTNGPQQISVGESTTAGGQGVTSVVNAASGQAITTVDASRNQGTMTYGDAYNKAMDSVTVQAAGSIPGGQNSASAATNMTSRMMVREGNAAGMDSQVSAGLGMDTIRYNYQGNGGGAGGGISGSMGGTDTTVNYQVHNTGGGTGNPFGRSNNEVTVDVYNDGGSAPNSNGGMMINSQTFANQFVMQKASEFMADTPEVDPNAGGGSGSSDDF